MLGTRSLVISVACMLAVSLYSLSELSSLVPQTQPAVDTAHHVSKHAEKEGRKEGRALGNLEQHIEDGDKGSSSSKHSSSNGSHMDAPESGEQGRKCYTYPHTEMWGEAAVWGANHRTDSAEECCQRCRAHVPAGEDAVICNVWVWCGEAQHCGRQYKECWLKHLAQPQASKPIRQGPHVPWTSGTIDVDLNFDPLANGKKGNPKERKFHVVTSAQGGAVHWQIRIHYYWYKKQKALCEKQGGCEMGGFTRLLHSGAPDNLMDEIPTVVVNPLPKELVEHNWYIVLNRPYAFVQWLEKANIKERYILMSEPDHIFLRPLPNFMVGETPAAFPFFYIEPSKKEFIHLTRKFTGPASKKQLEEIAPIGNSPTFMSMSDARKTMQLWMNISIAIFKDQEASKAWGWVQEMYGFAIGAWLAGIKRFDLHLQMMAQPPWDSKLEFAPGKPFFINHYTYGMDYTLDGKFTPGKIGQWRFDKRSHGSRPIPRNMDSPPAGMSNDLVRSLIDAFNEATDAIPCWNQYRDSMGAVVTSDCGESPKHFLLEEQQAKAASASI
mmetsp:Transcript_14428/g.39084  ORF Transcript_14428/g.39084 Transcript_14428/m.39084 type:complete len:552 (+) Transcript_14428:90-1745(+)